MSADHRTMRSRGGGTNSDEDRGGGGGSRIASILRETVAVNEALTSNQIALIDTILELRQPRPPDMPPSVRAAVDDNDNDAQDGPAATGPLGNHMIMSQSERTWLYADIYGRQPPERQEMERRLTAIENEVCDLPDDDKSALIKALRRNPLLVLTSSNIRLLLHSEDFDPRVAAARLARYWQQREAVFGSDAFRNGVFSAPDDYDLLRFYEKSMEAATHPDADAMTREVAREYTECVHMAKIAAFDDILDGIPEGEMADYVAARRACPELVASDEHKLQFLRTEDFAEDSAVHRMFRYWKKKAELFGPEALHRTITIGDLESQGVFLTDGLVRLMPGSDDVGRLILAVSMSRVCEEGRSAKSTMQFLWYAIHAAMENELSQKRGVVILVDALSTTIDMYKNAATVRRLCKDMLFECIPVKVRAMHASVQRSTWRQRILSNLLSFIGTMIGSRIVIHAAGGTDEEDLLLSDLVTFGIFPDQVPTELGGNVGPGVWSQWVEERRQRGV